MDSYILNFNSRLVDEVVQFAAAKISLDLCVPIRPKFIGKLMQQIPSFVSRQATNGG